MKRMSKGQTRMGSATRRRLEFEVVCDQVRRRKTQFVERLERRITKLGDCRLYNGTLSKPNGYPTISFRYKGQHLKIAACRVFVILSTCKPIPAGMEAAHVDCKDRRCVKHIAPLPFQINARTDGPYANIPF